MTADELVDALMAETVCDRCLEPRDECVCRLIVRVPTRPVDDVVDAQGRI